MTHESRNNALVWFILIVLAMVGLLLFLSLTSGCGFALINKQDISETHENFKVYRAHTTPIKEAEKVNKLGDLIEVTLDRWRGGKDGP